MRIYQVQEQLGPVATWFDMVVECEDIMHEMMMTRAATHAVQADSQQFQQNDDDLEGPVSEATKVPTNDDEDDYFSIDDDDDSDQYFEVIDSTSSSD